MKEEWMKRIQDSLCIILNHLLFVAASITVLDLFNADNPKIFLWMAFVVIPIGVFYFTKMTPKLIPPPMFILLLAGMSLAEKIMTTKDWGIYYYVITYVYLIGYFIYYFIKQFLDFLRLNQNTASNIPISDIFRNGIGLTLFFSACGSVILFVSASFDWVKAIADKIWSGVLVILGYIFSGIKTPVPPTQKEEFTQADPQLGGANMSEVIPEQTLENIRNLIIILLCIAIVIGFILFLYYVYYIIKGIEKSQNGKNKDQNLKRNEDIREYCGIEKRVQRNVGKYIFRNNREKIRRLYQKKVIKRKKEVIGEKEQQQLKYLTAKECCDKLSEQQLKQVYEKARYSEQIISVEDVKMAK